LDNAQSLRAKFSKVKVLVVGDVMLDRYWWGGVSRISPEAPVPVVNLQKKSLAAGGAANVAANVAGLTAEPFLVGVVGRDEEARQLPAILRESGVSADYLVALEGRPTTTKTRIVAHHQHIVRIDQEEKNALTADEQETVWAKIAELLPLVDLVVVSDYAKGLLTENLLSRLITKCGENRLPVLVDPKGKDYL
jgi:rfaE bifunctional protein kinase chain/domain